MELHHQASTVNLFLRDPLESVDEINTALKASGYNFQFDKSGRNGVVTDREGNTMSLATAYEQLALSRPYLVRNGAAHLRPRDAAGKFKVLSKSDFGDLNTPEGAARRNRYMMEFGVDAFDRLPLRSPRPSNVSIFNMTAAQYNALPLSQKSKIVSDYGSDAVAEILRRR